MLKFRVNEMFYSLQGEGLRAGTPNVFVRFSGCNLQCKKETHGFDCDTEFVSGRPLTFDELLAEMDEHRGPKGAKNCILTGGEPGLQVTEELVDALHEAGWYVAIESNGTQELPSNLDWVTISPKTAEHTLRVKTADEVKYVRNVGQALPKPRIKAEYYLISPAFVATGRLDTGALRWCIDLVKGSAKWRLSVQQHKMWNVR